VRRREFISLFGGAAAAWPFAARAQSVVPVIGFLDSKSARDSGQTVAAFHRGLNEVAFIDGQNVAIEYRWADNQHDRLPVLVRRKVALIAVPAIVAMMSNAVVVAQTSEGVEGGKASRGRGWHACACLEKTVKRLIARHPTAQGG